MSHLNRYDDYDPFGASGAQTATASDEDFIDPYQTVLEALRRDVTHQYTPQQLEKPSEQVLNYLRARGLELVREHNDQALTHDRALIPGDLGAVVQRMMNELVGLGEVEELLKLPGLEDIALNGPKDVWIKRYGKWECMDGVGFKDSRSLLVLLNRAIVHTGRQAGPGTPIVDAHLRGGDRINIVTDPLADPWPVAVIRKRHETELTMENLVAMGGGEASPARPRPIPDYYGAATPDGVFTPLAATFLHMAVVAGMNILVIGSTGVGKTTVLSALGRMIPPERRILVIEDTRELRMRVRENGRAMNCVYFTTRPESIEGLPAIGQKALVAAALRQRPDALTIGEARGAEVFDLLKAMWTGHRNGLTSIHAESLAEVSDRIRMMLQEAAFTTQVSEESVASWIAKAFHLGITLRMTETGRRYVDEIVEFTGVVEGRMPALNRLFANDKAGSTLRLVGGRLGHEAMFKQAGYSFDQIREAAHQGG